MHQQSSANRTRSAKYVSQTTFLHSKCEMSSGLHQVVSLKLTGARHISRSPSNVASVDMWLELNQLRYF